MKLRKRKKNKVTPTAFVFTTTSNFCKDLFFKGASALGLKRRVIWGRIILPQVFIMILPPLTNELTMLVKASPLLSVITVVELTRTAQQIMILTYRPVEVILAAAK
jgi:ABC-type amino acid transport system permease subunit